MFSNVSMPFRLGIRQGDPFDTLCDPTLKGILQKLLCVTNISKSSEKLLAQHTTSRRWMTGGSPVALAESSKSRHVAEANSVHISDLEVTTGEKVAVGGPPEGMVALHKRTSTLNIPWELKCPMKVLESSMDLSRDLSWVQSVRYVAHQRKSCEYVFMPTPTWFSNNEMKMKSILRSLL
jgi:hypothetical protein